MNGDLGRVCRTGAWVGLALCVLGGCNAAPVVHAAAPAAVVEDVRVATARSGLQQGVVTLPNGERMRRVSVSSGFSHVLVAKPGPDGKPVVSCVDSPGAAEAFLTADTQGAAQ
jgi:hypothetical protein